jgi:hypothetical protein
VVNHADRYWQEAIERPGANQVQFLRDLMESRPFTNRIPDQALLATPPGAAESHIRATRDAGGAYAFIYLPARQAITVDISKLGNGLLFAWWYNPRSGAATPIGEVNPMGRAGFTPPLDGPDWVLVLDNAALGFAPPGAL